MQFSTSDVSHPICFNSLVRAYQRWYKSFAFPGSALRQISACKMYFVPSSNIFLLMSWNINTIPYLFSSSLSLPNISKSEPTNYGTKFYNSGVCITALSSLQLLFLVLNHKFFLLLFLNPQIFLLISSNINAASSLTRSCSAPTQFNKPILPIVVPSLFRFGVRSNVNDKIFAIDRNCWLQLSPKVTISTFWMANWLLGGLVTSLQCHIQLGLVSSLGARWRWCTAPYFNWCSPPGPLVFLTIW